MGRGGSDGNAWRAGLLLAGFAALVIGPFFLAQGRTRVARDPFAQAVTHLLAVEPGMQRSVLESHLHRCFRRSDGVEIFAYPDSDFVRVDVRLDGPESSAKVIAVGSPYFAPFPQPDHLK